VVPDPIRLALMCESLLPSPWRKPGSACGTARFTAGVLPVAPGGGTPTGTVTLFDGDKAIGTGKRDAFGRVELDVQLSAGRHSLTAVYSGDGYFTASTSAPFVLTV
jgi:hypothetical protein